MGTMSTKTMLETGWGLGWPWRGALGDLSPGRGPHWGAGCQTGPPKIPQCFAEKV